MRIVLVSAPAKAAESLAAALVEERLAACVSLLPGVRSVYRWKGAVQRADETLLVAKTTGAAYARLARRIAELHPYDVPEIVALDAADVAAPYLAWVKESVAGSACRKTTRRRK